MTFLEKDCNVHMYIFLFVFAELGNLLLFICATYRDIGILIIWYYSMLWLLMMRFSWQLRIYHCVFDRARVETSYNFNTSWTTYSWSSKKCDEMNWGFVSGHVHASYKQEQLFSFPFFRSYNRNCNRTDSYTHDLELQSVALYCNSRQNGTKKSSGNIYFGLYLLLSGNVRRVRRLLSLYLSLS